jgi:hypothetical protein
MRRYAALHAAADTSISAPPPRYAADCRRQFLFFFTDDAVTPPRRRRLRRFFSPPLQPSDAAATFSMPRLISPPSAVDATPPLMLRDDAIFAAIAFDSADAIFASPSPPPPSIAAAVYERRRHDAAATPIALRVSTLSAAAQEIPCLVFFDASRHASLPTRCRRLFDYAWPPFAFALFSLPYFLSPPARRCRRFDGFDAATPCRGFFAAAATLMYCRRHAAA